MTPADTRNAPEGAPAPGDALAAPYPYQWRDAYEQRKIDAGQIYAVDAAASQVRIVAFRGGKAPELGHNHVLEARGLTGYVRTASASLRDARFDLELRLDELQLDAPAVRSELGPAFAGELDARAIAGTRAHMLGEDNLQADRFPLVHVRSLAIDGAPPWLAARVEIWMHGRRRSQWVPLDVRRDEAGIDVRGSLVVQQSDFGVQPYAVLGGLIAVQDPLVVAFHLRCSAVR